MNENRSGKILDLIVIGAGASGMTAAICATDKDINEIFGKNRETVASKNILIIEKNKKTGQKLYATGNGKCNISNAHFDFNCYNSENEFFPYEIIGNNDYELVNEFINFLGVELISENGYFYPMSKQASTVVWALNDALKKNGIDVHKNETVTDIEMISDDFTGYKNVYKITTDKDVYYSRRVVISCGGKASPKLGGTGMGYELLDKLSVPVIKPLPALCKLESQNNTESLAGVRIRAKASVLEHPDGDIICTDEGEIQFTEEYISGIAVFNISHMVSKMLSDKEKVILRLELIPDMNKESVLNYISNFKNKNPDRTLLSCLNGLINDKAALYVLETLNIKNLPVCNTKNDDIKKIISFIKKMDFDITAVSGFDNAQVTMGGADTRFVNTSDMSLKMYKNLYVTGEIIDVDGICGGYNLMWAIITGMKAGFAIYNDTN